MYSKKQIKVILDVLKSKSIESRSCFQRIFERGSIMWATNGYVVLELGEVSDNMKNKCITLERLAGRYATMKASERLPIGDLMEENEFVEPDMASLVHKDYTDIKELKFDYNLLKVACGFLGVSKITLKQHDNIYQVIPLEPMHVANESAEIKAYIMGL